MKKVGCFLILLMLIGLYILGSFFSEEDNTSPQKLLSDTHTVDSTAEKVQQPAKKTDTVVGTIITTPQNVNRVAKEMDWFATPEFQNLKVGDFIRVTGHPSGYIGAIAEPFGG